MFKRAAKPNIVQSIRADIKSAAFLLPQADDAIINAALLDISKSILAHQDGILKANAADMVKAEANNLSPAMKDRLLLTPQRIQSMAQSGVEIAALENPCGKILEEWTRPNGLKIQKVSVPIGVLGMIYESRPNVTVDAACLALKSRNAIFLRGGSDSFHSSRYLYGLIGQALAKHNLPEMCVFMPESTDRAVVDDMLTASDVIDVMIPRGGKGLTQKVMRDARMPVFAHLDGNCHIYVHPSARPDLALSVIRNAKLRRTGVCGATESLLFDDQLDTSLAHQIIRMLMDEGVEVVGDGKAQALDGAVKPAREDDWATEYLDKKISVKFVNGVCDAVAHINHYGSHHTDSILSEDFAATGYFLKNVDSAIVAHNASTQFADGGEFGFGAEIGIGTGKLHARGPVGVRQLCTFKYVLQGDGHIRP